MPQIDLEKLMLSSEREGRGKGDGRWKEGQWDGQEREDGKVGKGG